jgi:methylmalonyl-CoA epimerase
MTVDIDHLGIAVNSLDEALQFYADTLGLTGVVRETVEQERVNVAMLPGSDVSAARIELLEPANSQSVIARFLEKHGPGLHHVALRVDDLVSTVARLKSVGVRVLNDPQAGAGGHLYSFVHPSATRGVLLELIQK